ncbi:MULTISPECIES: glycogen debranching protein GlgX [unclassified Novosphingobium]|uniref:glycogen debranching protein GlgX n=1 Tax=unclassified Novosphingobium TaxID=2644732 RepID=UPI000D30855C|nr:MULTISPECIES: glycogen debranching protein GlgX [unclassified Novosphingobium]PTR12851.1 glycogen operon protein [Novosphingobium sp. GV055]PUB06635.1 glycogen operon protein [Novosphingobium sp. GV061]PUB22686.1 glycogen operon protein [Novosphingobium sp. GV079]PUB44711.1 glycogen operon protein [Novosphingobium sp. GV027]
MDHGAHPVPAGTAWRVRAPLADAVWLCLFDARDAETRHAMVREGDDWALTLPGDHAGARYGYRADGAWAPERGLWFDPAKQLVDPYAVELDQRFVYDPALSIFGADTAALVPKAIVTGDLPTVPPAPPLFAPGGLVYELNVRAFTMLHPDVPAHLRGTVAALAHPAVLAHLAKLGVNAVELMPIVAWMDERHLPPLGLRNAWGYNPVAFMALDPGLCPGGIAELRETVAALRAAGIGTILDLVFNHTGESDVAGPIVSLRGLDNAAYGHAADGSLINDTGCGNTLDFAQPHVRQLTIDALRHFVAHAGVDGFRFDLAPVMARGPGFAADAPIFAEIAADPLLADRVLIAEPWDIGPGGYQLGQFPANWLEWNDRYRDDVRRFWRGDGTLGALATRLAGSADVFGPCDSAPCRSVNFLAAHDGFTLADCVAFAHKHNEANGENNRDGHDDNYSWNNGVEGPSDDPAVLARRQAAQRALLGTLFASTGTIMLTAGDEFGRSQQGNNNAYSQDNPLSWIDWQARDRDLEDFVAELSAARMGDMARFPENGQWLALDGAAMDGARWEDPATPGVAWRAPDQARPGFRVSRAEGVALG